jgi:hypothetical protein
MIVFRALSDIQDECDSIDDTDRKSEDGAYVNKAVDVALIIEENSGHHHHHEDHQKSRTPLMLAEC